MQTPAFQPLLSDWLAQHSGRRLLVIWEFSDPSDVLSLSLSSARMLIHDAAPICLRFGPYLHVCRACENTLSTSFAILFALFLGS